MDWRAIVLTAIVLALALSRFVLGVALFAAPLPLRKGAHLRIPIALCALYVLYCALTGILLGTTAERGGSAFAIAQFVLFSLLLIALVGATLLVFDTNPLTALFCCSSGYTVQNFASGATELIWSLMRGGSLQSGAYQTLPRYAVAAVCTALTYLLAYLAFTKPLLRRGLPRIEDRSILGMMVLTIFVIIGFDLLIKGLMETQIDLRAGTMLRMFHGLACLFTLYTGFETLVRRRLETERDMARRLLAERERQYETSRENVEAINARVHDIRHAIGRVADAAQVDRTVLADIVRSVDVYNSTLRTGNPALDTVLAERGLACQRADVALSCVADGSLLAFMTPEDTFVLFSSLLDEAITRTGQLAKGRSISFSVREALGTIAVHLECTEPPAMAEAEAATHDMIAQLCERYGGTYSTVVNEGAWHANALFPHDR